MIRIMLFLFTNLSVMMLFGTVISLFGYSSNDVLFLMFISGIFGLGGAFISLFFSKSIALSAINGKIVNIDMTSNNMERWLLQVICNQSKKLNIVAPQLVIYSTTDVNAFVTGFKKNAALIAISTGLLENMRPASIEAVIAHEINHIASGDMITMTLIQGIINTFVIFISRCLARIISYGISCIHDEEYDTQEDNICQDSGNYYTYMIASVVLEFLFGGVASLIVLWFSRHREFYADAGAAKLVGCKKMILALQELKNNGKRTTITNESLLTLCIHHHTGDVKKMMVVSSDLFSSHPSLDKRINALRNGLYLNKPSCIF